VKSLLAQITIMPLGDSITEGSLNGYRKNVWELLVSSGYNVDFVGSLEKGTFTEKQHEGHGGWRDDEISDNVYRFLTDNPAKIILLHIGTNALDTNPSDVEDILDEIDRWEAANSKTVVVILAKIINRQGHECPKPSTTTTFNSNVEAMALSRINDPVQPDRIVIVDMECSAGLNYQSDMTDLLHPNPTGYAKMADKWFVDGLLAILPQADAGSEQTIDEKTLVTLDGSWSNDPDGASVDFWWEQLSGTSVDLSDPTAQKPSFTAPAVGLSGEKLEFKLTVTDTDGFAHSNTVSINVNNVPVPPSANAGSDQNVVAGRSVILDGSNSLDPDDPGGTFSLVQWTQISGLTQVTLSTPNELTTDFTAPGVDTNGDVLTFELTVMDNDGLSSSDTVAVNVTVPEAPVADAGLDQRVKEGQTVMLNGSGSHDPDGTISLVQWAQISGKNQITLTTPNELTTEFMVPAVDSDGDVLTFSLMVEDNDGLVSEDNISVTITPTAISTANSNGGGSGGGGCFIQTVMN